MLSSICTALWLTKQVARQQQQFHEWSLGRVLPLPRGGRETVSGWRKSSSKPRIEKVVLGKVKDKWICKN